MDDQIDDMMDSEEILTSMWPENINEAGSQLHVEKPKEDQDMLKEVVITEEPSEVDLQHLLELSSHSEKGSSQLAYLVNNWEYKQANAVRLLREEIDRLHKQRQEVELKHLQILEEHRFEEERFGSDKRPISILDNLCDLYKTIPQKKHDVPTQTKGVEMEAEYDTVQFWKQRALQFEKKLEASIEREKYIMEKLQESLCNMESQSTPVEELSQMLKRADNFIHFILQNAPIVLGHMDKDLRYRFIYNHYPSFKEEDIIGKTDTEIFSGAGVKESLDFKREVLERGLPGKREITFETELFGSKTFLIYVEPVFNKAGETIGVNYIGMDITDQVRKREKMAKLREEIAVQKAMETELNKTIHITEETMRAKQMLATMSHEIRSPLSGVVSMAEVLATTKLDPDQRQLLDVMISSGDLVLQLINDILDLSKVESGVMKLEATKFRPREVVRHVLQTAAASLRKMLTLEGHVADDVSVEVIGDVLRIRQILTNLISNAIKFTHEGKVGVRLRVVPDPCSEDGEQKSVKADASSNEKDRCGNTCETIPSDNHQNYIEPPKGSESMDRDEDKLNHQSETTVWICCDVYDTGIGIPESALPTLFKRYMQVSADHARKYGGTGLGLAICKQLVELMGGHMTVHSKEHCGSTFTFTLPYRVSPTVDDQSDDPDEVPEVSGHGITTDDATAGHFHFQPRTLGSLFSSSGSSRNQNILQSNTGFNRVESSRAFPSSIATSNETAFVENVCSDAEMEQSSSDSSLKHTIITGSEYASSGEQHVDNVSNQAQSLPMDSSATNVTQITKENETQERSQSLQSDINLPAASTSHSNVNAPEQKPKILLVEDNKINVMVTQSMMKQLGHNINVVNNGEEAVRAVQRCSYDLILMDVCMPKMDGLQATRIIRSFEESGNWDAAVAAGIELAVHPPDSCVPPRKKIPIIAMTANALTESAEQCYENGMDSFVSKPVTFQKLKQCLQDYLP